MASEPRSGSDALDKALKEFLDSQSAAAPRTPTAATLPAPRGTKPQAPEKDPGPPSLRYAYDRMLEHDAAQKAIKPAPPPTLWQRARAPLLLVAISVAAVYVWLGEPAWLAHPPHAELRTPRTGATARRQLVAIALEIEDYRRSTGKLPTGLSDLGLAVHHVRYVALPNGRFELSIGSGPHTARYRGTGDGGTAGTDSVETR